MNKIKMIQCGRRMGKSTAAKTLANAFGGIVMHPTKPTNPVAGDCYADISNNKLMVFDGNFWTEIVSPKSTHRRLPSLTELREYISKYYVDMLTVENTSTLEGMKLIVQSKKELLIVWEGNDCELTPHFITRFIGIGITPAELAIMIHNRIGREALHISKQEFNEFMNNYEKLYAATRGSLGNILYKNKT